MTDKPTGGPAFPLPLGDEDIDSSVAGMTLRDYFAAQVIAGAISNPNNKGSADFFVKNAYMVADAMIAERAK